MDPRIMKLRIKKWIPVIEEQAKSGMSKEKWRDNSVGNQSRPMVPTLPSASGVGASP